MEFFNAILISILPTFVAGFSGWFFTRRKYVAETTKTEIQNLDKAATIWREVAQNLKIEIDRLSENQRQLMLENNKLLGRVTELQKQVRKLSEQIQHQNEV